MLGRLFLELGIYLKEHRLGALYTSPADISWGPDILVQPDIFVVALDEAATGDWSRMRSLPLAIEVLSPSTARYDRFTKRRLYQEVGVPLYWLVDADARHVEVWTPDATFPVIEREKLVWSPDGARRAFETPIPALFGPV